MRRNLRGRVAALEDKLRADSHQECTSSHILLYDTDPEGNSYWKWARDSAPCTCLREPIKAYHRETWELLEERLGPITAAWRVQQAGFAAEGTA